MPKGTIHKPTTKKKIARATRKLTNPEGKKWNNLEAGPGRPKGSTLDKKWNLTPNQMALGQRVLDATNREGFFPASISELAKSTATDRVYLRDLLRREDFQKYINHLLLSDGIMLEMSFWRGMQLGLQVGDPKVLQLYANITGKIAKRDAPKVKVLLIGPDGTEHALPMYKEEITDAEIISEEDVIDEHE